MRITHLIPESESSVACCEELYFLSYLSLRIRGEKLDHKANWWAYIFFLYPFSSPFLEVLNKILDKDTL